MKHIEVDYHYVRHVFSSSAISLHHAGTTNQFTDLFTKALIGARHHRLLYNLGVGPLFYTRDPG